MRTKCLLNSYPFKNPNFFSLEGRLNRAKYLCTMLLIGACGYSMITLWPSFATGTSILASCATFFPAVKRLHDINRPGGWLLLIFIPGFNLVLGIVLLFKKGTVGTNQYGDDPLSKNNEKHNENS